MAFDGSGNYSRIHNWTADASNALDINAGEMDAEDNSIAGAFNICVTRDGQGKMSADFTPQTDNVYNIGTSGRRWASINSIPIANFTTQAGIGALFYPRTAAEVSAAITPTNYFYPTLNVMRYGATGGGSVDDTAACNAAIAVAAVGGGQVAFPAGNFKISSALTINDAPNVTLVGAGIGATALLPQSGQPVGLQFGLSTGASNQGFSNLSILCAAASSTCTAVSVFAPNGFTATNFLIQQANVGLLITNGIIEYFTNFQINRSTLYGVQVVGGNDQFFHMGILSSAGFTQPTAGFNVQSSAGSLVLTNLDVISQGSGIILDPGNGQTVEWLFCVNCAFDTNSASGIVIGPSGTGQVLGCDFTACWTASNTAFGVFLGGTGTINGVRLNGVRVQNNQQHGIAFNTGSAVTNVQIANCDISGNSAPPSSAGAFHGIFIGAGVGGFQISNNRIGQEDGYAVTQGWGILISAGASANYMIIGNDLRGNQNGTGLADGGTGANKTINSNLGYNPIGVTAVTLTGSPFTFTNNSGGPLAMWYGNGTISSVVATGIAVSVAPGSPVILPAGTTLVMTYTGTPFLEYYGII